ncbi:Fanconi anemia group F protein [Trichomycterus rosablanca]|uniref:Fanconi anemia group F protein n=1 Tax=Trichomycterus rosablanca TaxID=2290929 RepID=UPI002F3569A2
METVLKNLASTVQLLAVSHTSYVKEWNSETVHRAFQWAEYCEHLYTRFNNKPTVRKVLENHLRKTNELLEETLSTYCCLTLSDLAQCQHKLLTGLLKNPATPHSVIKALLQKFGPCDYTDQADHDLGSLIACRSACKLFEDISLNQPDFDFGISLGTQVHGMMLLQHIHAIQSPSDDTCAKKLLDSIFQDSAGSDSFPKLIASALLSANNWNEQSTAPDLLVDWLLTRHDLLNTVCQSLSPHICTTFSQQCPKFWLAYWDRLKHWASTMEYDVSNGLWVQLCDKAVSFQRLLERVKSSWSSGSPLKEETEKELMRLKQADGDFDVQGLSVWTDLLMQLK